MIDSHVHLYPPEVNREPAGWAAARGEAHWATLCTRRRRDGRAVQAFPSVEALLREMDRTGVARAVLLGWYWESPESCAMQNRFYAACAGAHPDRLSAYAAIQPRAGAAQALAELRRAREEGSVGVGELSPQAQGYAMGDGAFRAVLEQAGAWRWPVNLHVTDPESRRYPGWVETPLAEFVALARACPRTQFVLAHWGGLLPLREPAARELANVAYDTAASPLLYGPEVWARFLAVVPAERVLFGSDYPLNVYPKFEVEAGMDRLIAEARAAGAGAAVLGGNSAALHGGFAARRARREP